MKTLTLHRIRKNGTTIIGRLCDENNDLLCWTLENELKSIPRGIYPIDHGTVSPRFGDEPFYKRVCDGKLPRLKVPGRHGILIHCGNSFLDSTGCIIVGEPNTKYIWNLVSSRATFERYYPIISQYEQIKVM